MTRSDSLTVNEGRQGEIAGTVSHLDHPGEPKLLLRRVQGTGPAVLYVHGATFPSALSVAYRFDGRSWMDDLASHGFDVWAFDFPGYGGSERPDVFAGEAQASPPYGRAPEAAATIARVAGHIAAVTGTARLSIVAHSWGTIAAGRFAQDHPERLDRLVLFGPIVRRSLTGQPPPESVGAWRLVTVEDQRRRFVEDVPAGHAPVLMEPDLACWGAAYLASDPEAGRRGPPAVKIPNGPRADILAAWQGRLGYDPERITVPTLIVRGAWDSLCDDADARWLLDRLGADRKEDAKVPAATHLMHLETGRAGLFAATASFLGEARP